MALAARAPVALRTVAAAVRKTAPRTAGASTGTGHNPVDSSKTERQWTWWVRTAMLATLQHSEKESIDESPRPTWNAASIRAAPMRATEAQLRRGRPSADSDILQIHEISPNGVLSRWG
jgi:hypothetical protein